MVFAELPMPVNTLKTELILKPQSRLFHSFTERIKPTKEQLAGIDLIALTFKMSALVFIRISLHFITLWKLVPSKHSLLILDRPNPNIHYIDGPILKLPIKVLDAFGTDCSRNDHCGICTNGKRGAMVEQYPKATLHIVPVKIIPEKLIIHYR